MYTPGIGAMRITIAPVAISPACALAVAGIAKAQTSAAPSKRLDDFMAAPADRPSL
jgi:hypothetical protein